MKQCTICKINKSTDEFNKASKRKDGLQPACRVCSRKRSVAYYKRNRENHIKVIGIRKNKQIDENREFLIKIFTDNPCVDCGETDLRCLEFDHLRDKHKGISEMAHNCARENKLLLEIAKCDVVCANCHNKRTAKRSNNYRQRAWELIK